MWRVRAIFIILFILLPVPVSLHAQEQRCFPETGYCISGRIRTFWEQNGALPVFGYPVAPQQEETIEGRPIHVQWFERNRLELHLENQAPYDVLLGRLGVDLLSQQGRGDWQHFPTDEQTGDCLSFAETGHQVCGPILAAWRANGLEFDGHTGVSYAESLALFGLPVSSPTLEVLEGKVYTVQWFERTRFELHPENVPPYNVLLGLLGNEIRKANQATYISNGSEIDDMTTVGGQVFFSARDADHGLELWASDGTASGTRLVKDTLPGAEGGWPRFLADLQGTLVFVSRADANGSDVLWRSDGTEAGTVVIRSSLKDPTQLTVVGDQVFFVADDGTHGEELWATDGTDTGTRLVKDIYSGARGIYPEQNMPMGYLPFELTQVGQRLFFNAEAPGLGYGLWVSDGTAAGTRFVSHRYATFGAPEYWDLTALNDTLLFVARTDRLAYGLYRSDCTEVGTQLVYDFSYRSDPGSIHLYPPVGSLERIGNHVYMTYSGLLWETDGTPAGTTQVSHFLTGGEVAGIGNQAYFLSLSRPYGFDLVRSGPALTDDVVATAAPTLYQPGGKLVTMGRRLFIGVNGAGGRSELWVSDGTAAGTVPVIALKGRIFGQVDLSDGQRTTAVLGNRLLFLADDGVHGGELWASDGTPGGTMLVKDINTTN